MQKANNKIVKPRCVTARLVSVDRMDPVPADSKKTRLLFALDFGTESYPQVAHRIVESDRIWRSVNLTYGNTYAHDYAHHISRRIIVIERFIGKPVWILLEPESKLYFYADAYPLTLIKPKLSGNDHLSLLVTRAGCKKDAFHDGLISELAAEIADKKESSSVMKNLNSMRSTLDGAQLSDEEIQKGGFLTRCLILHEVADEAHASTKKTSIMAGQKIANEMQYQIDRAYHDQLIMMHGMTGANIDDHDAWSNPVLPEGCTVVHESLESMARELLEKTGVEDAESYSAGNLIYITELIAENRAMKKKQLASGVDKVSYGFVSVDFGTDHQAPNEDAPLDEPDCTPRYIVDQRPGIISVLDTQHPEYEDFFTGMSDLPWVVASWVRHAYGVAKECFTWQVKKAEHLAELLNSTGANQFPDYGLADMCGELQEQRDQLLAALKLLVNTSSPVSAIAYNFGQGHERGEWNSRIYPAIKNMDEAFSEAVKIINKCEAQP